MSVRTIPAQHLIVCDRCGGEATISDLRLVPDEWITIEKTRNGGTLNYYALCPGCVPAFNDLFKKPSATGRRTLASTETER
jgi:hypothetical protein